MRMAGMDHGFVAICIYNHRFRYTVDQASPDSLAVALTALVNASWTAPCHGLHDAVMTDAATLNAALYHI